VAFGRCSKCRGGTPTGERATLRASRARMARRFGLMRLPAFRFLYFVARVERSETRERHPSRTIVPGFRCRSIRATCSQGMIEPKAGSTAALGVTRSCSAGRFCGWRWHNSGAAASRERICFFHLSPPRGERSSEARVRGPLRESECRSSEPSGEAPSPHPLPARGAREAQASRE
jgi:hypothetical protein